MLCFAWPKGFIEGKNQEGPKVDLVCKPDVSGDKEDIGPPVLPWTCCESLSYISWQSASPAITNIMEAAGPQEVHRVHSRSARRPDTSASHSRSISDPIRSSWFLPSLKGFDVNTM